MTEQRIKVSMSLVSIGALAYFPLSLVLLFLTAAPNILDPPTHLMHAASNAKVFLYLWYLWALTLYSRMYPAPEASAPCRYGFLTFAVLGLLSLGFGNRALNLLETEEFNTLAHWGFLSGLGKFPADRGQVPYLDFPAVHLLLLAVGKATGARSDLLLIASKFGLYSLFGGTLYLVYRRWLNQHPLAALATTITLFGSTMIVRSANLTPGFLGMLSLANLLLVWSATPQKHHHAENLIATLVLTLGVIATHMQTGASIPFIALGSWIYLRITRCRNTFLILVVVTFVVAAAWLLYWATHTATLVVRPLGDLIPELREGRRIASIATVANANLRESLPLWARGTLLSWSVVIYGGGAIAGVLNTARVKRTPKNLAFLTGGLAGLVALFFVMVLSSTAGQQFGLFFRLAPFFTVPLLVGTTCTSPHRSRRVLQFVAAAALLTLSLPSFLVNHATIGLDLVRAYDTRPAEFLQLECSSDRPIRVFGSLAAPRVVYERYLLARLDWRQEPEYIHWQAPDDLWYWMDRLARGFFTAGQDGCDSLFVQSIRVRYYYAHLLDISPSAPAWSQLESFLNQGNSLYDNGYVTIHG